MAKVYKIIKFRRGDEFEVTGTLKELIEYFSYTLEVGNAYNSKIQRNPKTFKSFIKHLNDAFDEKTNGEVYVEEK